MLSVVQFQTLQVSSFARALYHGHRGVYSNIISAGRTDRMERRHLCPQVKCDQEGLTCLESVCRSAASRPDLQLRDCQTKGNRIHATSVLSYAE